MLCAASTRDGLLTPAFLASYPNRRLFVVDTQGHTSSEGKRTRPGFIVARHRIDAETGEAKWQFYGDWKPLKPPKKAPATPKRVVAMRAALAIVAAALGKAKDTTAAFLSSETGLKEAGLAALLEHAARGYVIFPRKGKTDIRYPLPMVGVRLVRDYLTAGGWKVEV
jgi:hypothetical protein